MFGICNLDFGAYENMQKIIIKTEADTKKFATKLAKSLKGGEILALEGPLGAGKTFITQQIAKYFNIKQTVTSPTFVLMKVYPISNFQFPISNLIHVDCYRLDEPQELFYLGIEEYINRPDCVVVIEWADKIKEYLKKFKKVIWVKISLKDKQRIINIK